MTTRWPSAVSSLYNSHNASLRLRAPIVRTHPIISSRLYASRPEAQTQSNDLNRPEKAALVEINGLRKIHPVNPPRSTRPPDLKLPERGDSNIAAYYFRVGRAYGSFYVTGIKAVWFNYKAVKALRERLTKEAQAQSLKDIPQSTLLDHIKRSEFQLIQRSNYDIGKLPFFGLLVAVFGEWLPLLVPFIPSAVPGTCRIPKQIRGMRANAEERRRISFRRGISEPSIDQIRALEDGLGKELAQKQWPMANKEFVALVLRRLHDDQLYHLSCTLNNHNGLWDRVQLPPPSSLLRSALTKRLTYIASDDKLLIRDGGAKQLSSEEVSIACEERGLDVLGKREESLRNSLVWWLERQSEDQGKGVALMTLLFRRLAIRNWVQMHIRANESRP